MREKQSFIFLPKFLEDYASCFVIICIILICIDNIEQGCVKVGCQRPLGSARAQP